MQQRPLRIESSIPGSSQDGYTHPGTGKFPAPPKRKKPPMPKAPKFNTGSDPFAPRGSNG